MYLEILKENLLSRWKKAFTEFELLQQYKNNVTSEKYIPGFRYDLDDYGTPSFLHPEDKVFPVANVRELGDYHFYGLSADGLPCYTSYGQPLNNVFWQGYYTYGKEWVEYIEYNTDTKIPSGIKRIQFNEQGEKIVYQSLTVNGRGISEDYLDMTAEEKICSILSYEHSLFCTIEQYEREDGRIVGGQCLAITPGAGEYCYDHIYSYDEKGVLDEIRKVFDSGESELTYVQPAKNLDVYALINVVAEQMAVAVVDTLITQDVEKPLSLLELSYHYADSYTPALSPRSVAFTRRISRLHPDEDIFDLIFLATELDHAYLEIERNQFERPYTQLMKIISREEKWEMGTLMLRKVAHILTTEKLFGRIPVGEEFAAYAVDWGVEMEDFEDVLRACGVSNPLIDSWKERGWL
ncbi:hypothetical protein [Chitinophaga rhizophila]|uniref:Uncharacterized protein n=1 Tax=Chitinophaga rhizophila TaxID=2866212 RepID=A0ABS7GIG3_9BACT|nr:hypothetical protein [Chitinophaga rhizophila]MBW8687469.1 hypothetical protein [Chitinophaga rhizophila]